MKKIILIVLVTIGLFGCTNTVNEARLDTTGEVVEVYKSRDACTVIIRFNHYDNKKFGDRVSFKVPCDKYMVGDVITIK